VARIIFEFVEAQYTLASSKQILVHIFQRFVHLENLVQQHVERPLQLLLQFLDPHSLPVMHSHGIGDHSPCIDEFLVTVRQEFHQPLVKSLLQLKIWHILSLLLLFNAVLLKGKEKHRMDVKVMWV
jgi:hypothetical protein